jgi:hypothetical protein
MRSQNKETNETKRKKRNQHIQKKKMNVFELFISFHLRGRNFRTYSGVGVVDVGVFLFPLVRAFFGGV